MENDTKGKRGPVSRGRDYSIDGTEGLGVLRSKSNHQNSRLCPPGVGLPLGICHSCHVEKEKGVLHNDNMMTNAHTLDGSFQ